MTWRCVTCFIRCHLHLMARSFACLKLKLAELCVLVMTSALTAEHNAVLQVQQSKVCVMHACWYCRCSTLTVCLAATSICASTTTVVATDTTPPVITVLLNSMSVNATTSAGLLLVVTTVYVGRFPVTDFVARVWINFGMPLLDTTGAIGNCHCLPKRTLCCNQPCLVEAACCLVLYCPVVYSTGFVCCK